MFPLVNLYAARAMVQAHLTQHTTFNEQMNVLVHRRQRDGRNLTLHCGVDLLRAWVSGHTLHHLIQHLPLMRDRDPVVGAQLPKCRFSRCHTASIDDRSYPSRIILVEVVAIAKIHWVRLAVFPV